VSGRLVSSLFHESSVWGFQRPRPTGRAIDEHQDCRLMCVRTYNTVTNYLISLLVHCIRQEGLNTTTYTKRTVWDDNCFDARPNVKEWSDMDLLRSCCFWCVTIGVFSGCGSASGRSGGVCLAICMDWILFSGFCFETPLVCPFVYVFNVDSGMIVVAGFRLVSNEVF
jgi:hypothetical protein